MDVVDTTGVTFMGARGARFLLDLARLAEPALIVVHVQGRHVTRVLDLTGLTVFFDVVRS